MATMTGTRKIHDDRMVNGQPMYALTTLVTCDKNHRTRVHKDATRYFCPVCFVSHDVPVKNPHYADNEMVG